MYPRGRNNIRGSPIDSYHTPLHNAKKYLELLTPWDADAVLMGELGIWTSELSQKYSFTYADYCTADDLEAIAATRGLGNIIANRRQTSFFGVRANEWFQCMESTYAFWHQYTLFWTFRKKQ